MGIQWGLFTAGLWRRAGNPYMIMCVQPAGVFPILNPEMSSCARDALAAGTKQGVCHEWEWSEVSAMSGTVRCVHHLVQEEDAALHRDRGMLLLCRCSE